MQSMYDNVNKYIRQYHGNVRHNVGKLEAILCRLKISFTYSISYCKDNI